MSDADCGGALLRQSEQCPPRYGTATPSFLYTTDMWMEINNVTSVHVELKREKKKEKKVAPELCCAHERTCSYVSATRVRVRGSVMGYMLVVEKS